MRPRTARKEPAVTSRSQSVPGAAVARVIHCCPDCRLRFTPADAAYLPGCPTCGEPMHALQRAQSALGFRLFRVQDSPHALPEAIAVAMPIPGPGPVRS